MAEWDHDIQMAGKIEIYWAVLRDDDGDVIVWQSPYDELPPVKPPEEGEERRGKSGMLSKSLRYYSNPELAIASELLVGLSYDDFIEGLLVNNIFKALREQREREGGFFELPTEKKPPEEEDGPSGPNTLGPFGV